MPQFTRWIIAFVVPECVSKFSEADARKAANSSTPAQTASQNVGADLVRSGKRIASSCRRLDISLAFLTLLVPWCPWVCPMVEGAQASPVQVVLDQGGAPEPQPLPETMPGEPRLSEELLAGRLRTTALIYATAMLERIDEQILPAVRRSGLTVASPG